MREDKTLTKKQENINKLREAFEFKIKKKVFFFYPFAPVKAKYEDIRPKGYIESFVGFFRNPFKACGRMMTKDPNAAKIAEF
jgi:hypothetical protein